MKKRINLWAIPLAFLMGASPMCASENNKLPKDISQQHFDAHVKDIESRLNRVGYSERTDAPSGTRATIRFRLDKDGKVSNIKLLTSSGIKSFDDVCIKAIEDRSPLRPFPKELLVEVVYKPKDLQLAVQIEGTEK